MPLNYEKKYLGTEGVQQLITNTRTEIAAAEKNAKDYSDSLAENYDAAGTAATKVGELADGQVKTNTDHIGTMDNLETAAKNDLVTAINEVRNAVSAGGTAAAMTMVEQTTGLSDGVVKAYVFKQGENTVGTVNIPKDMVVQSGEVVVDPEGQEAGTYIKMVLANATNDEIFVNVGSLVDVYKGHEGLQVSVVVDKDARMISANLMDDAVSAQNISADAVTTVKIADGNVTKAKLSTEIQASLDKADVAAQGAADAAAQALKDAKAYADSKVEGVDLSGIATNASDIDKLEKSLAEGGTTANAIADAKKAGTDAADAVRALEEGTVADIDERVAGLEAVDYVEITPDEINAMFAS